MHLYSLSWAANTIWIVYVLVKWMLDDFLRLDKNTMFQIVHWVVNFQQWSASAMVKKYSVDQALMLMVNCRNFSSPKTIWRLHLIWMHYIKSVGKTCRKKRRKTRRKTNKSKRAPAKGFHFIGFVCACALMSAISIICISVDLNYYYFMQCAHNLVSSYVVILDLLLEINCCLNHFYWRHVN